MDFLPALVSAAFAAGGSYAAVRIELRHVWRKLGEVEAEILRLRKKVPT